MHHAHARSAETEKLAHDLLFDWGMMNTASSSIDLSTWLSAVNTHLSVRRNEVRAPSNRPGRNRERERARREARHLFAQYYADLAIARAA